MRTILAIVVGVVLGGLVVAMVEAVAHQVYPPPPGVDLSDPEVAREVLASAPIGALLMVAAAWALGSLAGGWVSARICNPHRLAPALIAGGILMAFGLLNLLVLPHPLWFWPVGLIVFIPAAYLGGKLARH